MPEATSSSINRRKFMLAASSLGSVIAASSSYALAETGGGRAQSVEAPKPRILVFDVNETMLDLNALRPRFEQAFGAGAALDEWFSLLLQYSMVATLTDSYSDFGTIAGAVLEMLAASKKIGLSAEDKARILQGILTLPAHPDMIESLERLRAAGFRLVTLTNSSPTAVKAQLQNARLAEYFEDCISVDTVRRFKPDLQVYRSAAERLRAKPDELRLIAAHAWDVFGAMRAGWRAAFVARRGIPLFPLGPKPDIVAPDMKGVADALLG
jgi:2-haloacid dehalogenase